MKFNRIITFALLASGIMACSKQELEKPVPQPVEPEVPTVEVKINAGLGEETKSIFSGVSENKMLSEWTTNKETRFFVPDQTAVAATPGKSGRSTTFNVTLPSATSGKLWALSPVGNYNSSNSVNCVGGFTQSKISSTYTYTYVVIPTTQTPLANSCDESVHMVAASMDIPSTGVPSEIDLDFQLAIAFGKLTIKNFTSGKIKQAVLTFPKAVAGTSCKFQLESGKITGASESSITLLGDNIVKDDAGNFVLYFGLAESTHNSGNFVVTLTDETDATYSKTVTLSSSKELTFTTGHIRQIGVNMEGKGSGVAEGTTLWTENWTGSSANTTPSNYRFTGTYTYANTTLTYSQSSTDTKLYAETVAGGTSPELLISGGKTWTVENIPTGGAGTMKLTFKTNKTIDISSSTDGVTIVGSGNEWTVLNASGKSNISLTFMASANARIDDIELVWKSSDVQAVDLQPGATVKASSSGVGSTSADLAGSYSAVSGTVTEVGFEWGIGQMALTNKVTATKGTPFSYALTGLTANTTYYYRAYVKVKGLGSYASTESTFYSNTFNFTTSSVPDVVTSKLIYASCMEFPAVNPSLSGSQSYTATGNENDGEDGASTSNKWFRTSTGTSGQYIVTHTFQNNGSRVRNYSMLYDGSKKCALWVAFALNSTTYCDNNVNRTNNWVYDPALDQSIQPYINNSYTGSYDRGHQIASNDRQTTMEMNRQTYYFSNMTPQYSTLNQQQWATLEGKVQNAGWTCSGLDTLYVVTGPIFESTYSTTTDNNGAACPLPAKYYKCVMKCTFNSSGEVTSASGVAYLTPGNDASSNTAYTNWKTTIDAVEELTGFDFFTNVPKTIQDAAERTSGLSL